MNINDYELSNLKQIVDNQNTVIENLSNRLIQSELLISSITDLLVDQEVITSEELKEIMDKKIKIISKTIDKIKKQKENQIKPFPYFGGVGEA